MRRKAHGQLRRGQVITTWGPGALLDLPRYAVIVGGLGQWPSPSNLEEIHEARLARTLGNVTGVPAPRLYAPPADSDDPRATRRYVGVWQFPEWFVVQEDTKSEEQGKDRSRRMVQLVALEKGKFDGRPVVPTRFVRACPRGHVDDLDWRAFVHGPESTCRKQLRLDEMGSSGDLAELRISCVCGKKRHLYEATVIEDWPLGGCTGRRPWIGPDAGEKCDHPARLLIRTASNAYFPHVMSVLSIPEQGSPLEAAVSDLWSLLDVVEDTGDLKTMMKKAAVSERLAPYDDDAVLAAIEKHKTGGPTESRPVKQVELDALIAAKPGYGEDVPIDPDFHARSLPESVWRRSSILDGVESVVQAHRLREVLALLGFTRFESVTADIDGEYDTDVERAQLAQEPSWFPAVENRGEGIFIRLHGYRIVEWLQEPAVKLRIAQLQAGHDQWVKRLDLKKEPEFPGGPYILLHTLSHLLIQSLAMHCGYPASSIRERVYVDEKGGRFGILLYTGSSDAEGTLGGLVQQARYIDAHFRYATSLAELCSNDPVCAQHTPGESFEERWLHGAACHGCTLIGETSCEMRNDYLDRALVVPVLGLRDAAFIK